MTRTTKPSPDDTPDDDGSTSQAAAPGNDEVAAKVNADLERGYRGTVPDNAANEAYSLKSGPDGVPLVEDDRTRFAQPSAPKEG